MNQDGSPALRQGDPSWVRASRAIGGRVTSIKSCEATGNVNPVQRPRDWRMSPTPLRGPPVASIKAPRWHRPVVLEERRPRGSDPRGPLRGGPERSACDPQTPEQPTRHEANEGNGASGERNAKWPVIITIEGDGHERKWGLLSPNAAWKAGRFWEGGNGAVMVFNEKGVEE